ncbi:fructose-1,6-bisphosphatase [Halomicroarcula sp. S1AR25-4]|uniref:fructose 1,6-bisphosphatase n=1 Tax=Haloarcula sp. S1AR25-4 TaxID=2950538 RepID=UPI002876A044|nr:fructose 1,6-bisphosphatase [Halomicroarcula sp. S1AR25-4]MDS0277576.1 fructose-1,6-bisphosphatase [Halomicroarcula sp. S1AR25-4]
MRTVSVIKADVGSNAGHWRPTVELVAAVEDVLADEGAFLDDYFVFTVGDRRLRRGGPGLREPPHPVAGPPHPSPSSLASSSRPATNVVASGTPRAYIAMRVNAA